MRELHQMSQLCAVRRFVGCCRQLASVSLFISFFASRVHWRSMSKEVKYLENMKTCPDVMVSVDPHNCCQLSLLTEIIIILGSLINSFCMCVPDCYIQVYLLV